MITIIQRGIAPNRYVRTCDKCDTVFTYYEEDEETVKPPAISFTIKCPICGDKFVTRNYYKGGEIAFDHRKKFGIE